MFRYLIIFLLPIKLLAESITCTAISGQENFRNYQKYTILKEDTKILLIPTGQENKNTQERDSWDYTLLASNSYVGFRGYRKISIGADGPFDVAVAGELIYAKPDKRAIVSWINGADFTHGIMILDCR